MCFAFYSGLMPDYGLKPEVEGDYGRGGTRGESIAP